MIHFTTDDFNEMHHLYRINLINSCSGYKSANLIGTNVAKNASGANFSSATLIGNSVAQNATGATFSSATLIGPNVATNASGGNFDSGVFRNVSSSFFRSCFHNTASKSS
mgnify:CR=1 FL=1